MIGYDLCDTLVGGGKIDEIDKIIVFTTLFGATYCIINGGNFGFTSNVCLTPWMGDEIIRFLVFSSKNH